MCCGVRMFLQGFKLLILNEVWKYEIRVLGAESNFEVFVQSNFIMLNFQFFSKQ